MNRRNLGLALAALLLFGLMENWRLALWVVRGRGVGLLVGVTWLALLIGSVAGLVRGRKWGGYSLILLAVFSTVMLSTPLFPGMHLVGLRGPAAMALWNLVALIGGILVVRTPELADHGEHAPRAPVN